MLMSFFFRDRKEEGGGEGGVKLTVRAFHTMSVTFNIHLHSVVKSLLAMREDVIYSLLCRLGNPS